MSGDAIKRREFIGGMAALSVTRLGTAGGGEDLLNVSSAGN